MASASLDEDTEDEDTIDAASEISLVCGKMVKGTLDEAPKIEAPTIATDRTSRNNGRFKRITPRTGRFWCVT